jgi:hypothetical protein
MKAVLEIFGDTAEPRGTVIPPSTKFLCRMFIGGDTSPGENIVGPAVPSDTDVPMIVHKSIKTTTTSF